MTTQSNTKSVWLEKHTYDAAECQYFQKLSKGSPNTSVPKNSLAGEVAKARQHIKNSLECMDTVAALSNNHCYDGAVNNKMTRLEESNASLEKMVNDLMNRVANLTTRLETLEGVPGTKTAPTTKAPGPITKAPGPIKKEVDEEDDVDLFGSDSEEESEEAKKLKDARVASYAAKKSTKPILIAKSNIILDVKPWDDETDMKKLEAAVRSVECDGLLWGASKLVPLAYGIHKLQISCVVEDDKVSIDWLQETIETNEDFVQSVDIAAFNKV